MQFPNPVKVFGPPGSVIIYHDPSPEKKNLDFYTFWLLNELLFLKTDVNVPSENNRHLEATEGKGRIYVIQWYRFMDRIRNKTSRNRNTALQLWIKWCQYLGKRVAPGRAGCCQYRQQAWNWAAGEVSRQWLPRAISKHLRQDPFYQAVN